MLDLRRLEVLVTIADHGSLSAAAAELELSQPAVSHHLARLEAEAGLALLVRHPRGVRPTAAGEALLAHARPLVERARMAQDALADLRTLRAGHVELRAFPTAFVDLVPRALQRLRGEGAQFAVDFAPAPRAAATAAVLAGAADLAVVFAATAQAVPPGLTAEPLLEDPMLVVLARDHPLASRPQLSLEALRGERWVLGSARGADAIIRGALVRHGIDPSDAIVTDDLLAAQGIVAAGLAVTLTPALAVTHARPGVVLRALAEPPLSRLIDVVRRTADTSPAVLATIDALQTVAEELGG